jgi:hypothetical protein
MEQHRDNRGRHDLQEGEDPARSPDGNQPSSAARGRWRSGGQVAGWGFIALGIVGLILPVLPGWFFIALGTVTLAPHVPFFARLLDRVAQRVPSLRSAIERVRNVPEN